MALTKRQSLFLLLICFLVIKVQRLPSLIATNVGRHGWLVLLILGGVDVLFLLLVLLFNKKAGDKTTYEVCERVGSKWLAKIIYILFAIYFILKCILPYEAVHDIFANILFDHLSWELYSVILAGTILFVASRRLRNIGRLGELFFFFIAISFIVLLVLGAVTTNYYRTLPIADINGSEFLDTCIHYNLWFGDFLILYLFIGRVKQDDSKLGWPIIVGYLICVIASAFAYIVFYGLYEYLASNQNSLISSISQFSLLGLDIGRIDWFFVLFFQIGTVISSALYLFLSGDCFKKVFGLKKIWVPLIILAIGVYLADIFIFKSVQAGASIVANITKYFALFMIIILPMILFVIVCIYNKKQQSKRSLLCEDFKKISFLVKRKKVNSSDNLVEYQIDSTLIKKINPPKTNKRRLK